MKNSFEMPGSAKKNQEMREGGDEFLGEEFERQIKELEGGDQAVEEEIHGVAEQNEIAKERDIERLQGLAQEVHSKVQAVIDANAEHALAGDSEGKLAAIEANKTARAELTQALEQVIGEGALAMALALQEARRAVRADWADSIDAGNHLLNESHMGFETLTGLSDENLSAKIEELKARNY